MALESLGSYPAIPGYTTLVINWSWVPGDLASWAGPSCPEASIIQASNKTRSYKPELAETLTDGQSNTGLHLTDVYKPCELLSPSVMT